MSSARTDAERVELANTALYEAVERGDTEAMRRMWLDDPGTEVSCVHPGWPVLRGRGEVLRSYALIMASTDYIQFFLTDVEVAVAGDTALVTCTENILSGAPAESEGELGPLVGQLVVATNVFRRVGSEWKVWSHHGSPVLAGREDEEYGEREEGPEDLDGGPGPVGPLG
ncbi:nuclear transport factor 2 family protein [Streptomyces sp. CA-181903]|uniref:nuclear transport factor 2 family protein n=1 Tax=Streptomyces sp. CA-181903 TaxID=3240055 RepID=UPI003D9020FC